MTKVESAELGVRNAEFGMLNFEHQIMNWQLVGQTEQSIVSTRRAEG